jgi:alkylmercury lyase
MTTNTLDQLHQKLATAFNQGVAGEDHFASLFKQLLLLLVNGRPVTANDIAAATDLPREEAAAFLSQLPNAELDDAGNLVGMGLTLKPTPHQFEVEGRTLYTWCALDALIFPTLLEKSAIIESPCRGTGQPVTAVITPTGIEKIDPPTSVVSIVTPATIDDIRGSFCSNVHFFTSTEAAAEWLPQHPNTVLLPVTEAYQMGQLLAQEMFNIFTVPGTGCE